MTKQERKTIRTQLYRLYDKAYMNDQASVEALYEADFKWVMLEIKAGWQPSHILQVWKERHAKMYRLVIDIFANDLSLSEHNELLCNLTPLDYHADALKYAHVAYKIPSYLLREPIPPVDADGRSKTFVNTILGKPYDKSFPGGYIITGGCDRPIKMRTPGMVIYDELVEVPAIDELRKMIYRRPYRLSTPILTDKFSFSTILKTKENMDKATNGSSTTMSKDQKRTRIKEIEATLKMIADHRKELAHTEHCSKSDKNRQLTLKVGTTATNNSQPLSFYDTGVMLWPANSLSVATFLKIYKAEIDEDEAELLKELDTLIK